MGKHKTKTEVEQTVVKGSGEDELKQTVDNLSNGIKYDHNYMYVCDCVEHCVSPRCVTKQKLHLKLHKLHLKLAFVVALHMVLVVALTFAGLNSNNYIFVNIILTLLNLFT